ncbi:MAG: PAS domain S-box protein, partial [Verrucomicrobia bacterium]|nr:PAS domain S-box protein [Verrucomicrobiota bacterium]
FLEFVHPDDREATQIETRKLAAGEEVTAFENRYRCKDGSFKWLLWSATSLVERELIYAGARDYTERKEAAEKILKLNQELRRHASQLEAANQELEAFSFTISHDLRAPLRYVNGFLGLLQKGLADKLDEKSSRLMQVITQSTATMDQLILALLEFSRMSRAPLQTQRVPLAPLVREVCEVLEPMRPRSEIVWKISELPEVEADPLLLRLVWQNLLSNALKYSRHRSPAVIEIGSHVGPGRDLREDQEARATGLGGRALLPGDTASLAARAGDTAARDPAPGASANAFVFFVHDNGVGFDMEYVGRLFGVFQRLHPKDQYEGIGVGLATVRRIIARHGGGVWAEGKVGEGATFYFSLPRKAGES